MAEAPPRGEGAPVPDPSVDATKDASKKKAEAELRKRTTAMGLAPAPHLGGLGGSPGAIARAEQAARRQGAARLQSTMIGTPIPPAPPPIPPDPAVEVPRKGVAARLQATVVGHSPLAGGAPSPTIHEPAAVQPGAPIDGGVTALMTPESFRGSSPREGPEAHAWRGAANYEAQLPSSSQWEVAEIVDRPGQAGPAANVVIGAARTIPTAPPLQATPQRILEHDEPAPNTERMRSLAATAAMPAQRVPQTGLALRTYDPFEGHGQAMTPRRDPAHALSGRLDPRLVLLNEPDSARAASFRVLRDRLLGGSLPRVLAISSAVPNDGKTTCAVNLALALSESPSTKVLLVDANFFEPELGRVFTLDRLTALVPAEPWLLPYTVAAVTGSFHVAGIVQPAGAGSPRFEQHRFESMIDRFCRANYDYILLDTPALRGSPAVATLIAGADATLLAVRSGGTTTRDLRRAAEQIPDKKALGIALMDAVG